MSKFLVIVESPTKAKTINRFLGDSYTVKNSLGHVRDLPVSKLGVDVKNNFQPTYQIIKGKSKVIKELQKIVKKVDKVYIATDQDREGEAIGWHLIESISIPSKKIERIVFHEITKQAIEKAIKNPRQIDMHLINAQQARRILDRLVGYKLSPLLAKKIRRGLSAGRVQSIALRLIVDREKEIEAFKAREYWTIKANLKKEKEEEIFNALLIAKQGKKYEKLGIASEKQALEITEDLSDATYKVSKINKKEKKQKPLPPFTTSTLQQDAWQKLSFSAKRTMVIAQQLYEGISLGEKGNEGLITYMRTDSLNVAVSARKEANDYISEKYGKEYLPANQRIYKTKSKGAQEAHEAIRPTSVFKAPELIQKHLDTNQFKLYNLIWQRFLASQMADAILDITSIDIQAKKYLFRASGQVVRFKGFNRVYTDVGNNKKTTENLLPLLRLNEEVSLLKLLPEQHFTLPSPRYNEASLIKTLEKYGIGRPSTYAPTISTILYRNYVRLDEKRFFPEKIGIMVSDLLVKYFPDIVDIDFTAQMETDLDEIAHGKGEWVKLLQNFYEPFEKTLRIAEEKIVKIKAPTKPTDKKCKTCGSMMVIKDGRFGEFFACSAFPKCKYTEPILKKTGIKCPLCDGFVIERISRRRKVFYGCSNYPKCHFVSWDKPVLEPCPLCGAKYLVEKKSKKKSYLKCAKKECTYQKQLDSNQEVK